MNSQTITKIVLVFIILSFFLGFFWPVLFTPQDNNGNGASSPSPSAQPNSFTATTTAKARVVQLDLRMLFFCGNANQTALQDFKTVLQAQPHVERVLGVGGVYDVLFNKNATQDEYLGAYRLFVGACPQGYAFRRALQLEFNGSLTLTSNDTTVDPLVVRLPTQLCSQPNWNCFAFPSAEVNSTGTFLVGITHDATQPNGETGTIQQIPDANASMAPSPSPSAGSGNSTGAGNSTGNSTG